MTIKTKFNEGDKDLYDIPMTNLNFYNHDGSCPTVDGIDSFVWDGQEFKLDDVVVAGGHIGNIEAISITHGVCMLGLSYNFEKCIKNPYDWEMWSGFRCSINGLRHATEEEKARYAISADLTCDAAERADAAYKDRRAGFAPRSY